MRLAACDPAESDDAGAFTPILPAVLLSRSAA
jgi:hypothetical protein